MRIFFCQKMFIIFLFLQITNVVVLIGSISLRHFCGLGGVRGRGAHSINALNTNICCGY